MIKSFLIVSCSVLLLSGCNTLVNKKISTGSNNNESYGDIKKSVESMAEGIAGKELSKKELKALEKDIATNPETQSAVQAITNSITKEKVHIKYCPVCGKRYAPNIEYCPEDHAKLKILE